MAIKTLRVFQEFTSEGYVPMPPSGNIDYGYTIAGTFPEETPTTFQLDDPDLEVEVTEMTDFYVWIRSHGSEWNINYTRNVRVYPDSPLINNVVMGIIIANLDYTVPYVGATENVDLGEFGISGGFLHLDNTPTTANVPTTPGTLSWNDSDGTADLKLKGGNVTLQLGQEQVVRVVNKTGATLNEADFRAVRVRSVAEGGAQGQRLAVMLAQADSDADSATTIGLVTESILNNEEGFITTSGNISKVDTTGAKSYGGTETWVDGDVLYLSPTHPGYLTKVKPQAPDHTVIIGWVVYAHAVNGKIFVKVDNGYELDELHNVKINNPLLDDFLMYDTTLNVWKNKDLHGTKGYIPYYNDTTLFLNSPFWTNGSLVGLGTITPSALLHMKGTTAYTNVILDNNGATGGGMFSAYQNGSEVAMFGTDAYYQTNTSIDAAIAAKKVGGGIQFYTNGSQSEKMGINSDGNVFVGQTPTYVAGATQLIVRGKTGAGYLGVNHYDMSIKGFMNTFNSVFQIGTSTFHSLAFLVEDSERGRVNSSGRLLWGTTTDNGVDLVQINGSLIASSIKRSGGTSSQFLKADGSVDSTAYGLGTVTSVSASVPTGFAISGSPITTSGTLAITFAAGYSLPTDAKQAQWDTAYNKRIMTASMPLEIDSNNISIYQSSPTSNGYLSSTDWTTFNNKQNALNGSGFVKASGTTITYDNSTYVPTSRTLTINGVTFDLSANRSWTVGSELTASAPLSITGGVISISQATNTTNGFLSSTDWATFNAKQSALSGTGFVKVSGTTVSYDNTDYTPTSRLLTINGTSYDLSADRSWTITPGSGMRNIQTFTATSGQTTFTITGGYTVGLVDVFVNGTRLSTSDFTATNGTTIVLGVGVVVNDIVDIIVYTASLTSGITGSGTNGYIPKWTNSSILGNSLIYDNGTNVGIGTASPSSNLHVIGTILSSSSVTANSFVKSGGTSSQILAADGSVITAGTNITISGGVISASGGGSITGSGTTNYIAKWTGTGAIGNSVIFDNGTNVGIGTTTPDTYSQFGTGAGLTLQTSVTNGSSNINIVGNGTGFGGINFGNETIRRAGIYGLDGSALAFYTNNTNTGSGLSERLRIISNGNVGIGLTNPAYKLDVVGDINVTGTFRVNGTPFSGGGTTINGTGFVKANGTTISYDNSTYVPTNGTGATGTWGISVTGNSGSVGGVAVSRIVFGDNATKTAGFTNANDFLSSGFYNAYGAGNMPSTDWWHLITNRHSNESNNFQLQLASNFWDGGHLYFRKVLGSSGSATSWAIVLTSSNVASFALPITGGSLTGDLRTTGLRLNTNTSLNQGHRIFSRTVDVSAYNTIIGMRFTVTPGNIVQFNYQITFHASNITGDTNGTWYLRYTGSNVYNAAGNPNERFWDLREQAGNGIAGVGRNNNNGNLEFPIAAYGEACRLTITVAMTCNNWDAVTVTYP